LIEAFVPETSRRKLPVHVPPPPNRTRRRGRRRFGNAAVTAGLLLVLFGAFSGGCELDPLFERNSPAVNEALGALEAGDAPSAVELLEEYLATGKCESGQIGTNDNVREKPNAGFDLGLGLFEIGESFGKRFGDEESVGDAGLTGPEEQALADRSQQVDCALKIVELVALDPSVPIDLCARAHYLAGNLEFLRRHYKASVEHYDRALRLIPGVPEDAGDGIGRDAAWNRAIALRRIEDEENRRDSGQDAQPDSSDANQDSKPDAPDGGSDGGDSGRDGGGQDGGAEGGRDAGQDGSSQNSGPDGGNDAGADAGSAPDAGPQDEQPQPQSQNQDERMLDMLERAPTLQQQAARTRALQRQVRSGMEDK